MHCLVTAGPTFEPLDAVRRLTNFSTGRLGGELAAYLSARGHGVTLLLGSQATWRGDPGAARLVRFDTTADLAGRLHRLAGRRADAVFHAAAVSDFRFGRVWRVRADGLRVEVRSLKVPSRGQPVQVELLPTPKIIAELRHWFPDACLVGWKFEVAGSRARALEAGRRQLRLCRTDACVVNGPAYGTGFGLVTGAGSLARFRTRSGLFPALERLAARWSATAAPDPDAR